MNPKTDEVQPRATEASNEPSGKFTALFLVTAIIALVAISLWEHAIEDGTPVDRFPWTFTAPWIIASGQELVNGMHEFSGRPLEPAKPLPRSLMLTSLLLMIVVGPTLYLFAVRERVAARPEDRFRWPTSSASIAGAAITISTLFIVFMGVPLQRAAFDGLKEAQAIQNERDCMVNDLVRITWDIFEYRVSPKSMERGGGSVEGYTLSPNLAMTEIGRYRTRLMGEQVEIRGESLRYPGATITTIVVEKGTLSNWKMEREFRE